MHIPPFRLIDRIKTGTLLDGLEYFSGIGLQIISKKITMSRDKDFKKTARSISDEYVLLYEKNNKQTYDNTYWLGYKALKIPLDLWIYQEIIYETKPDIIIETGTNEGGSALFLASICDLIDHGKVITIDIGVPKKLPSHKRIKFLQGDAMSNEIITKIKKIIQENSNQKVMIILDDDHSKKHVLKELNQYHQFISDGCYLIVEDTCMAGHPTVPELKEGPMEAVEEFLKVNKDFMIDKKREKFFATFNPKGYLKKIQQKGQY